MLAVLMPINAAKIKTKFLPFLEKNIFLKLFDAVLKPIVLNWIFLVFHSLGMKIGFLTISKTIFMEVNCLLLCLSSCPRIILIELFPPLFFPNQK